MAVWLVLKKWLSTHLFKLSNRNLLVISGAYIAISWLLLALAGEHALTDNFSNFIYYLMVTASTVGLMLLKFCGCRRMLERKWSKALPKWLSPLS